MRPELAQDRVIESSVSQLKAEQIFPVDAAAHGVGGLPVSQSFNVLKDCGQCQSEWRLGRFSFLRKQLREILISQKIS